MVKNGAMKNGARPAQLLWFFAKSKFTVRIPSMARKPRIEIEGGLYHVIFRGNDRRAIFHSHEDHTKFLSLLTAAKERLPFFLYAFCLMTNHVHLLVERKADTIGRIMHRVLTGYCQYYNRRHKRVGHVLQGRHKAILCDSEMYMGELVRYIHLNPVRAKMVANAQEYPYSSHRAYVGLDNAGIVDVDPVLRLFAAKRQIARLEFQKYVQLGINDRSIKEFHFEEDRRILGSEEFVDSTIHRIGDTGRAQRPADGRLRDQTTEVETSALVSAVELVCGLPVASFYGSTRSARATAAKEALIVAGRRLGATVAQLAELTGINSSNVSRRYDAATRARPSQPGLYDPIARILDAYKELIKK
jgi:putative transposase